MARKQEAPFAVQIEASQGCNLGCDFCGIHAIGYQKKKRGLDLMSVETAESVASQMAAAGWNPRVEFAMHGEPTMHPALDALIAVFRKHLKRSFIMVTSNGGGLLGGDVPGKVRALFDAGLNTLALDNYENVNIVPKIMEKLTGTPYDESFGNDYLVCGSGERGERGLVNVHWYPHDKTLSPHSRHRGRSIIVIQDISKASDGNHSHLNNHAGSAGPLDFSKNAQRCAKPFREMSIRWDGNVAICCNDWPGKYRTGNAAEKGGLLRVWEGAAMEAARAALYNGRRDMIDTCNGCNAVSYRVGLLPDKLGKEVLPLPTPAQKRAIKAAQAQGPYTTTVK